MPSIISLVHRLYDRVRTLAKDCNIDPPEPLRKEPQTNEVLLTLCITALEDLRRQVILSRNMMDDYRKLEELSQRHEAQLRKHIGVEVAAIQVQQQLRLYAETIQQKAAEDKEDWQKVVNDLRENCQSLTDEVERLKSQAKKRYQGQQTSRDKDTSRTNMSYMLPRTEQTRDRNRGKSNASGHGKSPYAIRPKLAKMNESLSNQIIQSEQFTSFRPGESSNISYLVSKLKSKKNKLQHTDRKHKDQSGDYTDRRPDLQGSKHASQQILQTNAHIRLKTQAQIKITTGIHSKLHTISSCQNRQK